MTDGVFRRSSRASVFHVRTSIRLRFFRIFGVIRPRKPGLSFGLAKALPFNLLPPLRAGHDGSGRRFTSASRFVSSDRQLRKARCASRPIERVVRSERQGAVLPVVVPRPTFDLTAETHVLTELRIPYVPAEKEVESAAVKAEARPLRRNPPNGAPSSPECPSLYTFPTTSVPIFTPERRPFPSSKLPQPFP